MALIPWRSNDIWFTPFQDIERLQDEMNRLFNTSLSKSSGHRRGAQEDLWAPAVDIRDSKDSIVVKADIPGINREDIDVTIQDDILIIKGEKRVDKEEKEENYLRTERVYGSFSRAIQLSSPVENERVKATYKDGVLELVLPKKAEAKPKQLKIDVK